LPASDGWRWIAEGFNVFKRSPVECIGMLVIYFVSVFILLQLGPIGMLVGQILTPVFMAGFILGCRDQDTNKPLEVQHLFAAFSSPKLGALILLTIIMSLASSLVISYFIGDMSDLSANTNQEIVMQELLKRLNSKLPLIMLFLIPMTMASWFASTLLVLNNLSILEAMKLSFKACLFNIVPFILYKFCLMGLLILSIMPFFIGLIIFIPVVAASVYVSYKAIFYTESNIYEA
jgi:uncharacterized membrane protein